MSIRAVTFDKQKVRSQDDGLSHSLALVNSSCVISGCEVSQDGAAAVTISTGVFFVCGRLVYITSPESIGIPSVPAGQTQFMRVVFEVNLNQSNTEIDFMQGSFKVLTDASAYPALTQDDINAGGTLHQMAFIKLRADSVGIIAGSFANERTLKTVAEQQVLVNGTLKQVSDIKVLVDGQLKNTQKRRVICPKHQGGI